MASGILLIPVGDGLFRVRSSVAVSARYPFGRELSPDYYHALRVLALNLRARAFRDATGFGPAIHNRLRRFADFGSYRAYVLAHK